MATTVFVPVNPPPAGNSAYYRESHPYGPDGAGGFESGLGIEVDPAQLDPYGQALAVVPGLIRVIPAQGGTVDVVLKPDLAAATDLARTLGGSSVVFVYRGLATDSVRAGALPALTALPDEPLFAGADADERADRFMQGAFAVALTAGSPIGSALTPTGTDWATLTFEIVLLPGGLGMSAAGAAAGADPTASWTRLTELVAATASTRRYDPIAFYALIDGSDLELDTTHTAHPLFQQTTRRVLIEVRDEYDDAYTGAVTISGAATAPPAGSRGTFVLATVTGEGPAAQTEYQISAAQCWLTELPSAPNATDLLLRTLQAPAHWAIQVIMIDLAPADETLSWLVPNTGLPRYTEGNQVTPIRDGINLFHQYNTALRTANSAGHYIYINGWRMVDSFPFVHGDTTSSMAELTKAAATAGAEVRALLWDQAMTANTDEVNHINALPGGHGRAILDNDTLNWGTHHQKCVIVNGAGGATAWAGGIDINTDRRDTSLHGAQGPFHDVHARVDGPAVADLHRNFVDRWNAHSTHPTALPLTPPPFEANVGSHFVQIARTYPPQMHYPFAPTGSLVPLAAVIQAIGKAKKYIYIEDQYLTPYPGTDPAGAGDTVGVLTALRAALARIDYLVIVIPNNTDQPQSRYRRQQFIRSLRNADPQHDKVFVYFLGRTVPPHPLPDEEATEGGCDSCSGGRDHRDEVYCHTKLWIVDDIIAKIGSGNMNRRGYTHDSELDVVVLDGAIRNGARAFAKDLRLQLWGEHLNMAGARQALLEDHKAALAYWQTPPTGARIREYRENDNVEKVHTDAMWNSLEDPDGR